MAEFGVLQIGAGGPWVRSTVSLVVDGHHRIVIDPGLAPSQESISDPLLALGIGVADVTDVVISHHHPDHTVNVGMFPHARVQGHWATYHYDVWDSHPAEGFHVSPAVTLWETPGHTPQDISTLVETSVGLVVFTHLWFRASGPLEDPYATDPAGVHANRERVLAVADLIVPGHGPAFEPDSETPR